MPTSTRRQAHRRLESQNTYEPAADIHGDLVTSEGVAIDIRADEAVQRRVREDGEGEEQEEEEEEEEEDDEEEGEEEEADEDDDEEDEEDEDEPEIFPPPGLKEISSLASWTVSTAKPGNGVAALRSPDLSHFWQSDGPQPHLLSIHFFKLVSIVSIRVFLDFENDESYTPTKIQFLAGMGLHDIQEFSEMSFDQPNGWKDVDFSNVGPIAEDESDEDDQRYIDWSKRPELKAFILQVRILENHQNGKDTHLRSVQIFARDEGQMTRSVDIGAAQTVSSLPARGKPKPLKRAEQMVKLAPWMLEPDLR